MDGSSTSGCVSESAKTSDFKDIQEEEEIKPNDESENSASGSGQNQSTSLNSSVSLNHVNDINNTKDYLHDNDWLMKDKHIFILSSAGKPIYSLHGNEDKLATFFGVLLALVGFVQSIEDTIVSIRASNINFVFLIRHSLILVATSRNNLSVGQLQMQLSDVYNQVLSTLTYSHMTNIFEKRKNFDLRRLLAGSERLMDHLINNNSWNEISNDVFMYMTNSVRVMPLNLTTRNNIANAIQSNCSKIKNLVFALLIANNQLVSLVRMKKYSIDTSDLRLILNLIACSESFKTAESWTPICLPNFDQNGFLHAHVSYLSEDCQACLLLLSVDRDVFFVLSKAKKKITEKLRRTHCLEAINEEMYNKGIDLQTIGIPEMRHFIYKQKNTSQILFGEFTAPYSSVMEFKRLLNIYYEIYDKIHNKSRPLKLIYDVREKEVVLAWVTKCYEVYAIFEPIVDKNLVIKALDKLLKWITTEEDNLFIKNHPTF